ncbi:hypothetical protein SVAN01_02445 [Stagonosporopsis vannaccii]|nr:hypothetical protein SVAN01_02445 [Stagonosporopsis vannaccii]
MKEAGAWGSAHVLVTSFWATSTKLSEESSAFETAWQSAGSRDYYTVFTSTICGPRPLACFSLSSGNSGGTGGAEANMATGWCTIRALGDGRIALKMERSRERVERCWRPWHFRASRRTRINGTECCEPQGQHADSLRQPETRERATRPNAASAIGHSPQLSDSHKPALDTGGSAKHGQGVPGASTIHALRNPRRGVQRLQMCLSHPRPVAHNRPSTWIRFDPAAGVPCSLNTSHFRAGATHVLADVSALIKGNNEMSPVSFVGLDAVSMTCSAAVTMSSACAA